VEDEGAVVGEREGSYVPEEQRADLHVPDRVGREDAEVDFGWSVIELIRTAENGEITVLTGTAETLDELRKACELEGVKVG